MRISARLFVAVLLALSLMAPLSASALGLSFGGRVLAVLPCLNGGIYTTVLSSRVATLGLTEFYVWTPFTLTYLYGPPTHPGQQLLGLADIPYGCVISFTPLIILPGLRMQMVGTSPF